MTHIHTEMPTASRRLALLRWTVIPTVFLLLLSCSGSVPLGTASSIKFIASLSSLRRRAQENETAAPTSIQAALSPTQQAPGVGIPQFSWPTAPPTLVPPTTAPSPSLSTTITQDKVGSVELAFSVVHVPNDDDDTSVTTPASASDILTGRAPDLVEAVLGSLLDMLCGEMLVRVVTEASITAPNYCDKNGRRDLQQQQHSVVLAAARLVEVTNNHDKQARLTWTEWHVTYPVLQVGDIYLEIALQNAQHDQQQLSSEELIEEGLTIFQSVARLALLAEIRDGTLHKMWPENERSSVVGREVETYAQTQESQDEREQGYWEPFEPAPLHTLRLVGIGMLVTTLLVSLFVIKMAAHRRRVREWEEEYQKRGLFTEEGLERLLKEGKNPAFDMEDFASKKASSGSAHSRGKLTSLLEAYADHSDFRNDPAPPDSSLQYLPSTLDPSKHRQEQRQTKLESAFDKEATIDETQSEPTMHPHEHHTKPDDTRSEPTMNLHKHTKPPALLASPSSQKEGSLTVSELTDSESNQGAPPAHAQTLESDMTKHVPTEAKTDATMPSEQSAQQDENTPNRRQPNKQRDDRKQRGVEEQVHVTPVPSLLDSKAADATESEYSC